MVKLCMTTEDIVALGTATTQEQAADTPAATPSVQTITNPLTGEGAALDDADALIDLYAELDHIDKVFYARKRQIRKALAQLSEGDAKTRRVAGRRRKVKLTFPDDNWDQSILREVWNSYPDLRDDYLRINSLRVLKREFKKLQNTSGPPDMTTVRDMLEAARQESSGPPTIKIEL